MSITYAHSGTDRLLPSPAAGTSRRIWSVLLCATSGSRRGCRFNARRASDEKLLAAPNSVGSRPSRHGAPLTRENGSGVRFR